jgi:hypothetical protein
MSLSKNTSNEDSIRRTLQNARRLKLRAADETPPPAPPNKINLAESPLVNPSNRIARDEKKQETEAPEGNNAEDETTDDEDEETDDEEETENGEEDNFKNEEEDPKEAAKKALEEEEAAIEETLWPRELKNIMIDSARKKAKKKAILRIGTSVLGSCCCSLLPALILFVVLLLLLQELSPS